MARRPQETIYKEFILKTQEMQKECCIHVMCGMKKKKNYFNRNLYICFLRVGKLGEPVIYILEESRWSRREHTTVDLVVWSKLRMFCLLATEQERFCSYLGHDMSTCLLICQL